MFDFRSVKSGMPRELIYDSKRKRLYATTASKGEMHSFDVSLNVQRPEYREIVKVKSGANQIALTPDGNYGYIQNALFNFPSLSDGSISIVDLNLFKVVGTIKNLKVSGFNPNSIVFFSSFQSEPKP